MPTAPDSTSGDRIAYGDAPWVTVPAKGGRRRGRHAVDRAINFHDPSEPPGGGPGKEPGLGAASAAAAPDGDTSVPLYIEAEHARVVAWWRSQPSCISLGDLIQAHAPSHAVITRAVCLGAGSFGGPLDFGESIRRAHIQTEAFLAIIKVLGAYASGRRQRLPSAPPCN